MLCRKHISQYTFRIFLNVYNNNLVIINFFCHISCFQPNTEFVNVLTSVETGFVNIFTTAKCRRIQQ